VCAYSERKWAARALVDQHFVSVPASAVLQTAADPRCAAVPASQLPARRTIVCRCVRSRPCPKQHMVFGGDLAT
jgi:hypothetical protein